MKKIALLIAVLAASVTISACGKKQDIPVVEAPVESVQEAEEPSVIVSTPSPTPKPTPTPTPKITPTPTPVTIKPETVPPEDDDKEYNSDSSSDNSSYDNEDLGPDYSATEGHEGSGSVANTDANVRASADPDSDIVGSISAGDKVTVLGNENGWLKISSNGVTGYVFGDYIG